MKASLQFVVQWLQTVTSLLSLVQVGLNMLHEATALNYATSVTQTDLDALTNVEPPTAQQLKDGFTVLADLDEWLAADFSAGEPGVSRYAKLYALKRRGV